MSIATMAFTPVTGISDATYSPETPVSESAIRGQFQGISNQLRDYINNTLIPQLLASNIPNTAIAGMTSLFVQDALAELKTQINATVAGAIPAGTIADTAFSINNKSTPQYKVTTNAGNAYSVAATGLTTLTDGYPLCVKFNVASTGAITINPNSLGNYTVVDYFGNAVTNVRANLIANLRYDATNGNFQLQGKGSGGNTIASHVLIGETCTVDSGPITGTEPNLGSPTYTVSAVDQPITGFVNGGKVKGESALLASNIVSPNIIGGIAGIAFNPNAILAGEVLWGVIKSGSVHSGSTFTTDSGSIATSGIAGIVRVKTTITDINSYSCAVQLYKNGVAFGVLHTGTTSGSYVEDVTVALGDTLSVMAYNVTTASTTATIGIYASTSIPYAI